MRKYQTRWTFSGIKRFYPKLSFDTWLKIRARRQQFFTAPEAVVSGAAPLEEIL
jgi:hypothetical protein